MNRRKSTVRTALLTLLVVALAAACGEGEEGAADAYPESPIRTIVTFDPGGGSDIEARRIQSELEEELGVGIEIDYVTGGGGAVGWTELVTSAPDGYTAGISLVPHIAIQPLAGEDTGYDTDDMRVVSTQVASPAGFLVREDSEWDTFDDLLADIEENPGAITVGGVDRYSASDLVTAQFMDESGLEVSYVPLEGGAAGTLSSLQGGHVDVAALGSNHAIETDGVEALVLSGDEPIDALPDVPTFTEYDWDVQIFYAWGWAVPAETPEEIGDVLGNAVIQVMEDGGHVESVVDEGLDPIMLGPDEAHDWTIEQVGVYEDLLPLLQELEQQ